MKKQRNSNIELLRIICMFMIVAHHFMAHGGLWMLPTGANKLIVNFFMPFGKMGFDVFVVISCWFLTRSSFKGSRFMKTWLEVLFYNVVFTAVVYFLQKDAGAVGIRQAAGAFLPMIGNSHGYAAAYLVFYLMLPILKKVQENLNQRQTLYILLVLGMTQVILPIVAYWTQYTQPMQSEFLLFVFVFFAAYYLQNWPIRFFAPLYRRVIFALGIIVAVLCNSMISPYVGHEPVGFILNITSSEFSLVYIILGFLLFSIFNEIRIPYSKVINYIASTTFGILLFHDHNYLRAFFWQPFKNLYNYETLPSAKFFVIILAVTACVFVMGMLMDTLRQVCVESWLMKTKLVKKIGGFLDSFTNLTKNSDCKDATPIEKQ